MTLKTPAYAIQELIEKDSRSPWGLASEPVSLSLTLNKFNLFADFEQYNAKMFDPGYHFTPSIVSWDYGQNKPKVISISQATNDEKMVFGRNDSRTLLKPWTFLKPMKISGELNLLLFLHTIGKQTISLDRQIKMMTQLLDKSSLFPDIPRPTSSREPCQLSAVDQRVEHFLQAVKKTSGEWLCPISFLCRITLSMENLKSGHPIHIHKTPYFEMEFDIKMNLL